MYLETDKITHPAKMAIDICSQDGYSFTSINSLFVTVQA